MAKSMMNIVLDVGQTMGGPVDGGPPSTSSCSKFNLMRSCVLSYLTQRLVGKKTSASFELGVVACGSDSTLNALNEKPEGGYDNVETLLPIGQLKLESQVTLDSALKQPSSQSSTSITDGVIVASDALLTNRDKLKYTRILVLITDGESKLSDDDMDAWEQFIMPSLTAGDVELKKNVYLFVILTGVALNNPSASDTKKENAKFLAIAARKTGGEFIEAASLADCFWLLAFGPGLGTNPTAAKVVLELAPGLQLPCSMWKLAMKKSLPSISKKRKLDTLMEVGGGGGGGGGGGFGDGDAAGGDENGEGEGDGPGGAGASLIGDVKRDTRLLHPHDADMDLGAVDKINGFRYGAQYIPVTGADEAAMVVPGAAGMYVLGTVPEDNIKRQHFMESAQILQGHANLEEAQVAVCALATALRNNKLAILARYVPKDNKDPVLVVLLPPPKDNGTLLVHRVPCKEDAHSFLFPRTPKLPVPDAFAAMGRFIDACTVRPGLQPGAPSPSDFEDRILTPANPAYIAVVADITRRLLGGSGCSDGGDGSDLGFAASAFPMPSQAPSLIPDPAAAKAALAEMRALMPLTLAQVASGDKKKVFFSDILPAAGSSADSVLSNAAPPVEAAPVLSLGSTTPVQDLAAALDHAQSNAASRAAAMATMGLIALTLAGGASTGYYRKACDCLLALREAAAAEGERGPPRGKDPATAAAAAAAAEAGAGAGAAARKAFNELLRDGVRPLLAAGRNAGLLQMLREGGPLPFAEGAGAGAGAAGLSAQEAADYWLSLGAEKGAEGDGGEAGAGGMDLVSQRPAVQDSLFSDLM